MPNNKSMKLAKVPNGNRRYPLAVYVTQEEQSRIDMYFLKRPILKKGETVKQWILKNITEEELNNSDVSDQASDLRSLSENYSKE